MSAPKILIDVSPEEIIVYGAGAAEIWLIDRRPSPGHSMVTVVEGYELRLSEEIDELIAEANAEADSALGVRKPKGGN